MSDTRTYTIIVDDEEPHLRFPLILGKGETMPNLLTFDNSPSLVRGGTVPGRPNTYRFFRANTVHRKLLPENPLDVVEFLGTWRKAGYVVVNGDMDRAFSDTGHDYVPGPWVDEWVAPLSRLPVAYRANYGPGGRRTIQLLKRTMLDDWPDLGLVEVKGD